MRETAGDGTGDGLRFRRRGGPLPPARGRLVAMSLVLLAVAGALILVQGLSSEAPGEAPAEAPAEVVVEVRGEVPRPGFHPVSAPARLHAALLAAGVADVSGLVDAALEPGTRVTLEAGEVRLEPMDERLVFGLPLDVNTASAEALDALPGIGPGLAAALVEERARGGPFAALEDLERVRGIGPATVERLRPFVEVVPPAGGER